MTEFKSNRAEVTGLTKTNQRPAIDPPGGVNRQITCYIIISSNGNSATHASSMASKIQQRVFFSHINILISIHTSQKRLFANRDYVFNRRYVVDWDHKLIVVMNQSTSHPECPAKSENHRVKEYWSYMVIKAYTSFSEVCGLNGIGLVLEAFVLLKGSGGERDAKDRKV
uniref:Uncharacterized protein n=1 Tax=Timema shepardi TaxID=629360 RepID=A0A7R9B1F1_TIMSH|nr:unnamed protein product [Timema shepardi]